MHLVDEINLVAAFGRRVTNVVAQLTHVFHAVVTRPVDLDHIEAVSRRDLATVIAHAARRHGWAVYAIERLRENPGRRCLADAARPDEKISVCEAILRDRVLERLRDMFLPDQIIKSLWPIFSREDFVAHLVNLNGKVDGW